MASKTEQAIAEKDETLEQLIKAEQLGFFPNKG